MALFSTVECSRQKPNGPEAAYRTIEQRFVSGDLAGAENDSRHVKDVTGPSGPVWAAKFHLQRARILLYQGRYIDVLQMLRSPLAAAQSDVPLAITRDTLLSVAMLRTGDRPHAVKVLTEAERLCPSELACAEVRQTQGICDLDSGQPEEARRVFTVALDSSRTRGDTFLQTQVLINLGVVALHQEHYDEAVDRFASASTLAKAIGARVALEKATGNVGAAMYKLGDYHEALANSQLARQQAASLGVPVDEVRWLNNAGLSQVELGELGPARSSFEQSLQLARSSHNPGEIDDALIALADLSLRSNALLDALAYSREAKQLALQRGNTTDMLGPLLIEALALERQGNTSAAKDQLLALENPSTENFSIRWEVENALARLADDTGDPRLAQRWFQKAVKTFRSQRSSVADINLRLPFVENGVGLYLSYVDFLIREGKQEEALRVLDEGRAETLLEGLRPAEKDRANDARGRGSDKPNLLAKRLDATLLIYCLRPESSYMWAVTPGRTAFMRLPGQEVLRPLIDRYTRAILASADVISGQNAAGYELYRDLVEPAAGLIPPGSKVFLIPDQEMNSLNFETLLTSPTQPHFWIEDVDVVNARSLSFLTATARRPKVEQSKKKLLLIGDPIYDNREYQSLPHAREEMTAVSEHFASAQRMVLTRTEATPAAYEASKPANFSYIHFVAHGIANSVKPLDSAVVLSAPASSGDPYKLYARDILDRRLSADLVTISSCYGSGVRSYAGEGLVGLSWAFLRAGAHNVIGALWEVNDASTPRLIDGLYDGLVRGESPSASLRSAKLAMIHSDGVFRKPYYWASFQLYAGK